MEAFKSSRAFSSARCRGTPPQTTRTFSSARHRDAPLLTTSLEVNICGVARCAVVYGAVSVRQTATLTAGNSTTRRQSPSTVLRAVNAFTEHSYERRVFFTGVFDNARAFVDSCRVVGTVRLYRYRPLVCFR
jgi:hypothetical protein